ncbi:MAG: serine hydrolase [Elusimicrobiota bacterium]
MLKYRQSVLSVLGPHMTKKLLIVRGRSLYGLIYDRDRDALSTREIADYHNELLTSSGLEKCAMVASEGWPIASAQRSNVPEPAEARRPAKRPVPALPAHHKPSKGALASLPDLEKRIDAYIQTQRRRGTLRPDESTSWSVYDLTSKDKLVDINEDKPMQAASLVKPFFAMAFFHQVREGKLHYGPKSRRQLTAMIRRSDNRATNWILRRLGGPQAVDELLKRSFSHLLQDTEIVEYIPWGGRTYRNKSSVHDYSRFLYALWHDNVPGADEIKRIMALPNRDRIFTGARDIPKGTKVYDKTGSTRQLCGNMGILEVKGADGKKYAYTLVGVIEKDKPASNYTRWISSRGDLIREVSNIVYREMDARHGLSAR